MVAAFSSGHPTYSIAETAGATAASPPYPALNVDVEETAQGSQDPRDPMPPSAAYGSWPQLNPSPKYDTARQKPTLLTTSMAPITLEAPGGSVHVHLPKIPSLPNVVGTPPGVPTTEEKKDTMCCCCCSHRCSCCCSSGSKILAPCCLCCHEKKCATLLPCCLYHSVEGIYYFDNNTPLRLLDKTPAPGLGRRPYAIRVPPPCVFIPTKPRRQFVPKSFKRAVLEARGTPPEVAGRTAGPESGTARPKLRTESEHDEVAPAVSRRSESERRREKKQKRSSKHRKHAKREQHREAQQAPALPHGVAPPALQQPQQRLTQDAAPPYSPYTPAFIYPPSAPLAHFKQEQKTTAQQPLREVVFHPPTDEAFNLEQMQYVQKNGTTYTYQALPPKCEWPQTPNVSIKASSPQRYYGSTAGNQYALPPMEWDAKKVETLSTQQERTTADYPATSAPLQYKQHPMNVPQTDLPSRLPPAYTTLSRPVARPPGSPSVAPPVPGAQYAPSKQSTSKKLDSALELKREQTPLHTRVDNRLQAEQKKLNDVVTRGTPASSKAQNTTQTTRQKEALQTEPERFKDTSVEYNKQLTMEHLTEAVRENTRAVQQLCALKERETQSYNFPTPSVAPLPFYVPAHQNDQKIVYSQMPTPIYPDDASWGWRTASTVPLAPPATTTTTNGKVQSGKFQATTQVPVTQATPQMSTLMPSRVDFPSPPPLPKTESQKKSWKRSTHRSVEKPRRDVDSPLITSAHLAQPRSLTAESRKTNVVPAVLAAKDMCKAVGATERQKSPPGQRNECCLCGWLCRCPSK